MATLDHTRPIANSGSAHQFGSFFATLAGAYTAWKDARDTRRSLSSLTDRELDDIGLCRADIDVIAGRH